jgi:hypothetical protein
MGRRGRLAPQGENAMDLGTVLLAPLIGIGLILTQPGCQGPGVPAQAPAALVVRGGAEPASLLSVALAYAAARGLELEVAPEVEERLAGERVGLLADLTAAPAEIDAAAQGLLALGGFVVAERGGALRVAAWQPEGPAGLEPLTVAPEDLARLDGAEALYVRTAVPSDGNAAAMAVALRTLLEGSALAPRLSEGPDSTLEIRGPAGSVRALVALIRGASGQAEPAAAVAWDALFPPAREGLALAPGDTLAALLARYAAATGLALWVEPDLGAALARERTGLQSAVAVAPDRVHAVVEALLAQRGISIAILGAGRGALHAVQREGALVQRGLPIDMEREDQARLRDHACTLFAGVLRLPATEVRSLTTTLRPLMLGGTSSAAVMADHALWVQGRGSVVALLGALALGPEQRTPPGASVPAAPVGAELVLAHGGERMLSDLLAAYARAGGAALVQSEQVSALARRTPAPPDLPAHLSPAEADRVLLAALRPHGLTLARLLDDPPLLAVAAPGELSAPAHRFVAAEELDQPGREQALLVLTPLLLPGTEVRAAAARLRGTFDSAQDQALAFGDHTLVLGGRLADVRARAADLLAADAAHTHPAGGR